MGVLVFYLLERDAGLDQEARDRWVQHWIALGLETLEALLVDHPSSGDFCEGDTPGLADCCLVPQAYNARRFKVDLAPYASTVRIDAACRELDEFTRAAPENQADAPPPGLVPRRRNQEGRLLRASPSAYRANAGSPA